MLAAFQLRRDLRAALRNKGLKTLDELFDKVRDDWGETQLNVKAPVKPFTSTITRRRDLVLVNGVTVQLVDPKSPNLERIFGAVPAGDPAAIEFSTTGETRLNSKNSPASSATANPIVRKTSTIWLPRAAAVDDDGEYKSVEPRRLHHRRRRGLPLHCVNVAPVRLFDPARGGGLWLASNYAGEQWPQGAAIGGMESANPASLAAFLTLLMQDQLVDRDASTGDA